MEINNSPDNGIIFAKFLDHIGIGHCWREELRKIWKRSNNPEQEEFNGFRTSEQIAGLIKEKPEIGQRLSRRGRKDLGIE